MMKKFERSNQRYSRMLVATILVLFLMLPSLMRYLLPVTSMAAGVAIGCGLVVIFKLHGLTIERLNTSSLGIILLFFSIALCGHFVVAAILTSVNVARFFYSAVLAGIVIISAIHASPIVFNSRCKKLGPEKFVFYLMLLSALFSIFDLQPSSIEGYNKTVFPFTEPSHFAIAFTPLLLWICVTSRSLLSLVYLATALFISLLLQSLTLVVGVILVAFVSLPVSGLILIPLVLALATIVLNIDLTYFSERINFEGEVNNLSLLVFIQGWQLAGEALTNTNGWGIGFQQLGENETLAPVSYIIKKINNGDDANITDGGFTAAKIISEFGLFGLTMLAIYIKIFFCSFLRLRLVAQKKIKCSLGTALALSIVVAYAIELFIRGAGYFTGTGLLFLAAMHHLRTKDTFV